MGFIETMQMPPVGGGGGVGVAKTYSSNVFQMLTKWNWYLGSVEYALLQ